MLFHFMINRRRYYDLATRSESASASGRTACASLSTPADGRRRINVSLSCGCTPPWLHTRSLSGRRDLSRSCSSPFRFTSQSRSNAARQ